MSPLERYLEWIKLHGGTYKKLEFGNGFVSAKETIVGREKIATLPFKLAITEWKAREAFPELSDFSGIIVTAVFIADQKSLGEKSFYAPYLNILPTKIMTPLFYDAEDLLYIQNTNLALATEERKKSIRGDYERLLAKLSWSEDRLSWDQLLWAYSILTSRSFPYKLIDPSCTKPSEALFPLLDALNHKPNTKITWKRTGEPDTGSLSFVVGSRIDKGKEVFNNYGPKSNEELLLGYGFCLEYNEYDHIALKPNFSQDPSYNIKQKILEQCNVQSGNADPLTYYLHRNRIPLNFQRLMRVMVMNSFELKHYATCSDIAMLDFIGYRNEFEMYNITKKLLESRLDALHSVAPKGKSLTWWQNYAVSYRHGQSDLINSTILATTRESLYMFGRASRHIFENDLYPSTPFLRIHNQDYQGWKADLSPINPSVFTTPEQLLSRHPDLKAIIEEQFDKNDDQEVITMLALIQERANPDSPFKIFFERIAASDTQPDSESLAELQDMYDSLILPLSEAHPKIFDLSIYTLDALVFADHIVANHSTYDSLKIVLL